jgi:hypothetical protein
VKRGDGGAPRGAIAIASGGGSAGGAVARRSADGGRAAPNRPEARANTSPPASARASTKLTARPRRSAATVMVAGPTGAGAHSSAVTTRSRRVGSDSVAPIARARAPITRPPKAPLPCCQPSGTSQVNRWSSRRISADAAAKSIIAAPYPRPTRSPSARAKPEETTTAARSHPRRAPTIDDGPSVSQLTWTNPF